MPPPPPHPPPFDFYVLAQTWLPALCCSNPQKCPRDLDPHHFLSQHLALHGLWPSNSDGTWPKRCSKTHHTLPKAIPQDYYQLSKYAANLSSSDAFVKHEWREHGSCTGLDFETYFKESIRAHVASRGVPNAFSEGTPLALSKSIGSAVPLASLRSHYLKRTAIECAPDCSLEAIYTCYSKLDHSNNNKAGPQIDCPKPVLKQHDTCKRRHRCANVKIRALHQCS